MEVGQKVKWDSHGGGAYTTKRGKVVRVVTLGENPFIIGREEFPNHVKKFDGFNLPGGKETKVAYFVEVMVSPTAYPRLYMPYPKTLVKES